tara:strand:+ start:240 stop:1448 length:1209 start_codon:yes stop_codon:yes gene_type:complete
MAITRLTDFVTVATSKWTYGDSAFKYEGEVNQDHDTIYPLMIMTPPSSRMPDIYEGWEHYNVEMEFYNTYQTAAQNAVTLQQRWDNLQDLALEWLDKVLINYSGGTIPNVSTLSPTPTQVYIDKESLRLDRVKNDKNDKLCRITMNFDMRMFTRCFTPKSVYPDTISKLGLWMKSDSNVTFNIPTKKVSSWKGMSPTSSIVTQADTTKQALRYGYDGPQDKSQIVFSGSDSFNSSNNMPLGQDGEMSLFFVVRNITNETTSKYVFSSWRVDNYVIRISVTPLNIVAQFINNGTTIEYNKPIITTNGDWFIFYVQLKNIAGPEYSIVISENNTDEVISGAEPLGLLDWTAFPSFQIGCSTLSTNTSYEPYHGDISEVIGYNKAINSDEKSQVLNYLNNKYKIY